MHNTCIIIYTQSDDSGYHANDSDNYYSAISTNRTKHQCYANNELMDIVQKCIFISNGCENVLQYRSCK